MNWLYIAGGLIAVSVVYTYMKPKKPQRECPLRAERLEKLVPKYKDL